MADNLDNVMATYATTEAEVFRGCTSSEIVAALLLSLCVWGSLLTVIGIVLDRFMMAMGFSLIACLISVFVISTVLQRWKRNRPDGYYLQVLALQLQRYGLRRSNFVTYGGQLETGRSLKIIVVKRDE